MTLADLRASSLRPRLVRFGLAAAVAVPTMLDAWSNVPDTREADVVTFLLVAGSLGALLVRDRWPLAVALVCAGALGALYALGHRGELLSLPFAVAVYTVVLRGDRRRTVVVGFLAAVWLVVAGIADASLAETVLPVAAVLLGETVRSRRALLGEYAAHAARAEAEREREARRRVEEERLRIAREVHDVVAHTVTAMNVQAGVALDAQSTQPSVAREAMLQVRRSGQEAVEELRAMVTVLRDDTPNGLTSPAPRLEQLGELVELARGAGIRVSLHREAGDRVLPALVELAAYRIVQEALTNVIRHADATQAAVSVTPLDDALVVEIVDDGVSTSPDPSGGFGLIGMRERAAAVGGTIEYGPRPERGFRVRAMLPIQGVRQ